MFMKKFFVLGLMTLCGTFYTFSANAESTPQVLFKLHDIKPVLDSEGMVSSCEFSATFYNRTGNDVASAQIDFSWKDEVIINDNEREEKRNSRSSRRVRNRKVSGDSGELYSSINLPPLKNDRQITLKSKVETDKCFLLLENVDTKVVSCAFTSKSGADKGCVNLFKLVTPDNQQYYVEFKSVLVEEEAEQEKSQYQQLLTEIESGYDTVLKGIQNISTSMMTE